MSGEDNTVRLNKWISDSGACSRREADRLIGEGRVRIDGRRAQLGDQVLPSSTVEVDGRPVRPTSKKVYIALNKPVGIVCTADPRESANVVEFVNHPARVFPIGRLDKDSHGLLLMTNDGDIVNRLLRAEGRHEKEYVVAVDRPIDDDFISKMSTGVEILDRKTLPCKVRRLGRSSFNITLVQGLNRQIRRMCAALGYNVTDLERVRIMNIHLGRLKVGDWRNLTHAELNDLTRQLR